MDFYDIAGRGCELTDGLARRLGFKRISTPGADFEVAYADEKNNYGARLAYGTKKDKLLEHVRRGVGVVAIADLYIDKKLMEAMRVNHCMLVIPLGAITLTEAGERSKNVYRAGNIMKHARSLDIEVSFASMASSIDQLLSAPQMIEVSRMIGADRQYAKYSLNTLNKKIIGI